MWCGGLPRRAEDELVQWMNSLRRRGVLELDELVYASSTCSHPPSMVVVSPIYSGLGPLPKYEREGIPQWMDLKGDE